MCSGGTGRRLPLFLKAAVYGDGPLVADLKLEIGQQRPSSSAAEEALLNLLRTADCLHRAMQRKTRTWGVTSTQYNVLRILRGSQPQGLTCTNIGSRMIAAEPDITRLLARLKALKLIRQQRDKRDRRVLWTHISEAGLALLADMDPVIEKLPGELLGHLDSKEMSTLTGLLELARSNCQDAQTPVSCNGAEGAAGQTCSAADEGQINGKRPEVA